MLKINNLSKNYENIIVYENFNLEVKEGDIVVLTGKSGTGKTTLLRCICGLEKYKGKITKKGKHSYLFQEERLLPWLNIKDNILLPIKLTGGKIKKEDIIRMNHFAFAFGIKDHLNKKINEISGGQKQRVMIIQAIILDYPIILLDEPFKSLEKNMRYTVAKEIINYFKKTKKTVIISGHDIKNKGFFDKFINLEKKN